MDCCDTLTEKVKDFIFQKLHSKKFLGLVSIFLILVIVLLIFIIVRNNLLLGSNTINHEIGTFKLISPILDCQATNPGGESVVNNDEVKNEVATLKEKYNLGEIAVYFRDLNNGPWVGVREKEGFEPASLLKLPLLISFLNYSEDDSSVLNKKVIVEEKYAANALPQNIKPAKSIEVGKEYTLEQVAESMIIYSDNIAFNLLADNVPKNYIDDLFNNIGVTFTNSNNEMILGVKDYASFLRVLYNASYLNKKDSEKALDLLSRVDYKNGLVAGVPGDVIVAHKFGERALKDSNVGKNIIVGETQLHDCGIVYYPGRPYILCVMTRGFNLGDRQNSIQDISSFFYKKIKDLDLHS